MSGQRKGYINDASICDLKARLGSDYFDLILPSKTNTFPEMVGWAKDIIFAKETRVGLAYIRLHQWYKGLPSEQYIFIVILIQHMA